LRIKINRVPKHNDSREMLSSGDLSIFFHLGQPLSKNTMREDK
jgi:hypothetical protein